jgi:signal transduction histidine kinase
VDSLLLLARGDKDTLSVNGKIVDIARFCDENSEDWRAICSLKDQHLNLDVSEGCSVLGNADLLSQLLLNLVSNASNYSEEKKQVGVRVRKANDGRIEIAVTDEGIGIPDSDRSRQSGGTGLGLSICKMIAALHQGEIELDSTPGSGTTATVLLPSTDSDVT